MPGPGFKVPCGILRVQCFPEAKCELMHVEEEQQSNMAQFFAVVSLRVLWRSKSVWQSGWFVVFGSYVIWAEPPPQVGVAAKRREVRCKQLKQPQ